MLFLRPLFRLDPGLRTAPRSRHLLQRQRFSSKPSTSPSSEPSSSSSISRIHTRLTSLNAKFPRLVRRWTTPLLRAPTSQVISFLLLHELTAVIPLFGLVGIFHYTNWLPPISELAIIQSAVEKFGRYARKKGWLREEDVVEAERETEAIRAQQEKERLEGRGEEQKTGKMDQWWFKTKAAWRNREGIWAKGETGTRWLIEFATAWVIVKGLIIPRLVISAWATPVFARLAVEPVTRAMSRRVVGKKSGVGVVKAINGGKQG